ncbi:hypothetical protein V8G54_001043 [Vigna mungo]|uniref:Cupin type-1 domain-containing protein n=1 Tax=Vigna mungo TaxID=3915 RepID=A0AAQ3P708_VIGMU
MFLASPLPSPWIFAKPGVINNTLGSLVIAANAEKISGLNTLGVSFFGIDYKVGGLNLPHTHPHATEIVFVLDGQLDKNSGDKSASVLYAFNNQLLGTFSVVTALLPKNHSTASVQVSTEVVESEQKEEDFLPHLYMSRDSRIVSTIAGRPDEVYAFDKKVEKVLHGDNFDKRFISDNIIVEMLIDEAMNVLHVCKRTILHSNPSEKVTEFEKKTGYMMVEGLHIKITSAEKYKWRVRNLMTVATCPPIIEEVRRPHFWPMRAKVEDHAFSHLPP